MSNINVQHDIIGQLFYAKVLGGNAELHYTRHGDDYLDFQSTTVPTKSQNYGIGTLLVEEGLAFAKEQQLKVEPSCEFVQSYITKHPEYKYLLVN